MTTLFSDRRMFLAAKSRWMHCQGMTQGQRVLGKEPLPELEAGELLWEWGEKRAAVGSRLERGVGICFKYTVICNKENNSGNEPRLESVF